MTTSHHGPYELGYKCVTMKMTKRCNINLIANLKNFLSTDYILKLECMKEESLVIVSQHITVNCIEISYKLPVTR